MGQALWMMAAAISGVVCYVITASFVLGEPAAIAAAFLGTCLGALFWRYSPAPNETGLGVPLDPDKNGEGYWGFTPPTNETDGGKQ